MKKEYVNPSVSVVKIGYAGMLCNSGDNMPNFDIEDDLDELPVHTDQTDPWGGDAL